MQWIEACFAYGNPKLDNPLLYDPPKHHLVLLPMPSLKQVPSTTGYDPKGQLMAKKGGSNKQNKISL